MTGSCWIRRSGYFQVVLQVPPPQTGRDPVKAPGDEGEEEFEKAMGRKRRWAYGP